MILKTHRMSAVSIMAAFFLAIVAVAPAMAISFTEIGDAGETIGTANNTAGAGVGTLDDIMGTITTTLDADMYRIFVPIPSAFSATTVGLAPGIDTRLFLFTDAGFGVYTNDDDVIGSEESTLPSGHPLGPTVLGDYFLAISAFDRRPVSLGGDIFPSLVPFDGIYGPTGPGGGSPISGWGVSASDFGPYTIHLTGAMFAVPEPSSFLCLGSGLVGLMMVARRLKRVPMGKTA